MKPFENMGKGENAGDQHFLLFPAMSSTHPKHNLFSSYIFLSSAKINALNLELSKKLPFTNELKPLSHFSHREEESF